MSINEIRRAAEKYVAIDLHIVPYRKNDNRPKYKRESFPQIAVRSKEEVQEHISGNISLYHPTSGTCALDIDNLELTKIIFSAMGIDLEEITKGAWQIDSGRQNRSKYIFEWPESAGKLPATRALAWPDKENPGQKNVVFEIRGDRCHGEILPPSIHPKTMKPYKWAEGRGPFDSEGTIDIPEELLRIWKNWETTQDGRGNLVLGEKEMMESLCPWSTKKLTIVPSERNWRNVSPDAKLVIDEFDRRYTIEDILQGHGYTKKGQRFFPPGSKGNNPGIRIIPNSNPPRIYSDNAGDPLANGYAHGPFSAAVVLDFNGDYDAALKHYSREFEIKVRNHRTLSERQIEKQQKQAREVRTAIAALDHLKNEPDKLKRAARDIFETVNGDALIPEDLNEELSLQLQRFGMEQDTVAEIRAGAKERADNPFEIIDEFNQRHAVIGAGGSVKILEILKDSNGQPTYQMMNKSDASLMYSNRFVSMGGENKRLLDAWLSSPARETYRGLGLNPRTKETSYMEHGVKKLNLFKGSPHPYVEQSKRVNISSFLDFVKEILCCDDQEDYEYLLNWCAQYVQKPWKIPMTAIVLVSPEEGLGKGLFVGAVGRLMPAHYYRIDSIQQLTDKHNEHFQTGMLFFCDEATYGGDHVSQGIIRGIIAEKEVMINPKHSKQYSLERFVWLMLASNHNWPAPISKTDRRFKVLQPDNKYRNKTEYYKPIAELMETDEGMAAFYSFLMDRDISSFVAKDMPDGNVQTKAEISLKSANIIEEYIMEALTMKVEPGDQNKMWIDKTYSKGPAMGRKLGPFANLAAIKKEIVQLSQDRKLRAPSSNEIRVSITRMGIADYKRLNGQVGFRFKDYEECVNIFCTHMNIPKEMITAEDDDAEGYDYDEDSF